MSGTKNRAFRTSLSGYNREDVNKYILEINNTLSEKDTSFADVSKKLADAEARLSALSQEADALRAEKSALENIQATLRETIDTMKDEASALTERATAAEAENARLSARLAEFDIASPEEDKSQKYDRISAQIGDIMISANTSADAIVAAANDHAAKIIADSESEAAILRSRISDTADEMLSRISGELHAGTDSYLYELTNALREMRDSTSAMINDFQKRSRDLSMKVEYYQATLTETVNTALSEMDEKYGIRAADAKTLTDAR